MADSKTKNPKRVAAGKKAWRKAHRGGKVSKRKKGRFGRAYHKAASKLGTLVKVIACMAPAAAATYSSYVYYKGAKLEWKDVLPILGDFGSWFTGIVVDAAGVASFRPERLLVGWGPVLVIGGITYAERKVGMSGANPFRVLSTLG